MYSIATPTATEVLVGGTGVIWRSTDGGRTFAALPLALPTWRQPGPVVSGLPVVAMAQGPDGALFAATGRGVARSRDGGDTWQVISEPVGDPPVLPGGLNLRPDGTLAVKTQSAISTWPPSWSTS